MEFSNISIVHSFSQSSLRDEVSVIHGRLKEAETRLQNLSRKGKSSAKVFQKNNSLFTEQFDTKRSTLTNYPGEFRKQRSSNVSLHLNHQTNISEERSIRETRECSRGDMLGDRERQKYQQRISVLEEEGRVLGEHIVQLQTREYEREIELTRKNARNESRLNRELEELKNLIKIEIDKSSKSNAENTLLRGKIQELINENCALKERVSNVQFQLEALNISKSTLTQYKHSLSTQETDQKEKEYQRLSSLLQTTKSQYSSYRSSLYPHYKQCLILCEFISYVSQVLNKLKLSEIPATAVMIREQLCYNLPMVNKMAERIKEVCPGLKDDKEISWKRKEGLSGRRFISGDQKENVDSNGGVHEGIGESREQGGRKEGERSMMGMLLAQAQVIQQLIR